ncbi:PGF-pre-PGF domain-containing protein, partial [Candidatus Woesearchaeota archaeon]|nr:PGF-pre-PGF domain-containing protein [Candidatus Woesearchaeota archaeon]
NTILYGVSTAGYGINNTNFNNVTVKNCIINKGLGTGTQSYGIYFSNSSNHTITNNTINTNGTSYAYGIYFDRANQSRINNSVITTTWGASSSGIVNYASNNNITGNTISVNGTSDSYGMDIQGNNNIVFRNMVSTNGNANANYGIYISGTSNTVNSSNISTYGTTRNRGIFLDGTTSSTIINSIIITNGSSTFNAGIEVDGATSSVIRGNKINTTGTTDNYGIYVLDSTLIVGSLSTKNINIQTVPSSTTIDSNEVNSNGSSSPNYALYLRHATTTTILNNNFTSISRDYSIFDDYGRNILIYNNSYGQINWSVSNLTTNISLKIGETIFLENNNIGLTSSNQKLNLTGPARIELRQLSYTTPQLLKNGTRCDNSNACNITYSGSTLYALVSSFSNYSAQETPTDSSSSSSSSSGGGGGGPSGASGGISTGAAGKFAQETWTSINAGEIAAVKVENGEIGITEITFATEKTTYGAWVKVEKVENLPSSVPSFVGETYRNIKISHSNIEKAIKGSATIQFKVEKSWLVDHKTSSDEVVLYRNIENKWVQLTTTVGEDDGTYVHYTAETPGFSYFVIGVAEGAVSGVAKDVEDVSKDVVAAAEPAAEETAGEQIISLGKNMKWKWLLPLIVAVIAAFALIWIYTKK